jgi:hypothetical protein
VVDYASGESTLRAGKVAVPTAVRRAITRTGCLSSTKRLNLPP